MDLQDLAAQLRQPTGEQGKSIGAMMNNGNKLLNEWCLDELNIEPNDNILEIGMGNGYFVKDVLKYDSVRYSGVDFSETMIIEAEQINAEFITAGRVGFHLAEASQLPFADDTFSKIFTINTIYFWADATKELSEIKRVCKPGGKIVFGIRSKETMNQMPFTEFGFVKYSANELQQLLKVNAFRVMSMMIRKEPAYQFNNETVQLENIITSCTV